LAVPPHRYPPGRGWFGFAGWRFLFQATPNLVLRGQIPVALDRIRDAGNRNLFADARGSGARNRIRMARKTKSRTSAAFCGSRAGGAGHGPPQAAATSA
jgi:hypothetical protein